MLGIIGMNQEMISRHVLALCLTLLLSSGFVSAESPPDSPLVIGHRGAPGYLPEHTLAAYDLAIDQGADFIEPDLVISKDGVLFARHENEISGTTDVAEKFSGRRTRKVVDGRAVSGWFSEDFTAVELKTLRARERLPFRNQTHNGRFPIPTLREVLELARRKTRETGRTVGIYPETKHPTYFRSIGLPLEEPLVKLLREFGHDNPGAPVFIQSFETGNLRALKQRIRTPLVQLLWRPGRRPFDHAATGDPRTYGDLLTQEGLAGIARYASGIGLPKKWLLSAPAGSAGEPSNALVEMIHRAGLRVHVYTFRNEARFIAAGDKQDPRSEYLRFFRMGVDGVFSDYPDTAVAAREAFLKGW